MEVEWGKNGLPTVEQVHCILGIRGALMREGLNYGYILKASWPGAGEGMTLYGMECVDGPLGVLVAPR